VRLKVSTRFVFVAAFSACLTLSLRAEAQPTVIVKIVGDATAGNEETITITSIVPNPAPPPATVSSVDTIKISLTAADVANNKNKSAALVKAINAQAANVKATDQNGSLKITPNAGNMVAGLSFSPTTTVQGKKVTTDEVLRLNPNNLNKGGFVAYNLNLQGTGQGGLATLDLGNPANGNDLSFLAVVTNGELSSTVVSTLASEINAAGTLLVATPLGASLLVTGAMDNGNDNNGIDFSLTDAGITYAYGVSAVPEPSPILLASVAGSVFGAIYWFRRRKRVAA
jgi:hypothetical protein